MATAKIVELTESNTCNLCDNAIAKYSCPRCQLQYCSLDCYKSEKHLKCTELFYKECVENEVALGSTDIEKEHHMKEILRQMQSKNSEDDAHSHDESENCDGVDEDHISFDEDDEEYQNLCDRFANVDVNGMESGEIWEKLTEDEKQEFVAFLRSGDVSKLIPAWEPWWLYHDTKKIKDLDADEKFKSTCPSLVPIKDFISLSAKQPANCVKYNLLNVLASYVLTVRYFNGECLEFAKEAVSCIGSLSLYLKSSSNFEDFDSAVKSVEQESVISDWIQMDQENIKKMKEDLNHILKGPNKVERKYYMLCALSDIHQLISTALKEKVKNDTKETFNSKFLDTHLPQVKIETNKKMKSYLRTVEYFLSYTKDCFVFN